MQKEEDFFACKWTVDEASGAVLLLAAGLNAALRVIDVSNERLQWVSCRAGGACMIQQLPLHVAGRCCPQASGTC